MCDMEEQRKLGEPLNAMKRQIEVKSSSRLSPPRLEKSSHLDEGCMCTTQRASSEGRRVLREPPAAPQPRAHWAVQSDDGFRAEPPFERRKSASLSSVPVEQLAPPTLATLRLKKRAEQNQLIVEARALYRTACAARSTSQG